MMATEIVVVRLERRAKLEMVRKKLKDICEAE